MCGIIGIISKHGNETKITMREILELMQHNKHRGENDGFGFSDIEHGIVYNFTHKLKDILNFIRLKDLFNNNKLTNSDIKIYKKSLIKYKTFIEVNNLKSNMIMFHHRKKSYGEISLVNTHPINVDSNIYYMQNGTVYGIEILKNYLLNNDSSYKFNGDTDTEIISRVIEKFYKSIKGTIENKSVETYKYINKLFDYYGVLIRMDINNKDIIIYKHDDRDLYLYDTENEYIIISEPITQIKTFNKCYKINNGVLYIKDGKILSNKNILKKDDITKDLKSLVNNDKIKVTHDKCLFCGDTKNVYNFKHFNKCLNCTLNKYAKSFENSKVVEVKELIDLTVNDNDNKKECQNSIDKYNFNYVNNTVNNYYNDIPFLISINDDMIF